MNLFSRLALLLYGPRGWEPMIRLGMFVPLCMRKRADDGQWIYRDPTEKEIADYLAGEAW